VAGITDKTVQLVAATSNRLRLVQVDFADQGPDVRREYLSEEIERALSAVVPDQRQPFLAALMEQFPSWDARVELQLRKDDTTERSLTDARELQDPNFLVARLIDCAAKLGGGERKVLVERLKEAGLASITEGAWPAEAEAALRQELRLPGEHVDPARTLQLVGMASDFALRLDQLVWGAWQKVSPKSTVRRDKPLQQTLKAFITGSQDVPRGQVATDLEKLRQLIASLISSVGQAGRQFASRHLARFSPSEIEALASMEGGGFLVSKDVKCWKKYKELADAMTEVAIENEITETIANYAENLMKGLGR
jgi:DNA primase